MEPHFGRIWGRSPYFHKRSLQPVLDIWNLEQGAFHCLCFLLEFYSWISWGVQVMTLCFRNEKKKDQKKEVAESPITSKATTKTNSVGWNVSVLKVAQNKWLWDYRKCRNNCLLGCQRRELGLTSWHRTWVEPQWKGVCWRWPWGTPWIAVLGMCAIFRDFCSPMWLNHEAIILQEV